MKPSTSGIMPLLRSDTQGRLLAELFLHPEREYSLRSLAKAVGVSPPTIQREIDRLVDSGFLHENRLGNTRLVRAATEHPIFQQVADIALYGYGPQAILPDLLGEIPGIETAFIFGSWASRYEGQRVGNVGDLDVVVVGNPSRRDLMKASAEATRKLRIETNIQRVSREQWADSSDTFVSSIKSQPRIEVHPRERTAA